MSQKFSLKWSDFQSNVSNSFGLLRNEDYLHDVIIVTDDNEQIAAHKLVLSASSEYFESIFKRNKSPNLLMCIEGVSSEELKNVLDYIYNGEVQIFQEHIDRFLEVAHRFKLEGLLDTKHEDPLGKVQESVDDNNIVKQEAESSKPNSLNERTTVPKIVFSGEVSEIDQQIFKHVEKSSDGTYICKICGKSSVKKRSHIRNHIETHVEGLSFDCQHCGKDFRSRNLLSQHVHFKHKSS